ncbi:hypothetical protein [Nephila clavipes virus 2]|uniref:hypothetical protein n=1 Tax=Nephila clavipes virus 2 TaxID=2108205 RepID=UPI000D1FEC14|nr:hypothetical protein [Nephila clavipes virus 2]AVK59477.1 hypothetical protein [Nephila clavipes virus 2]
MSSLDEFAMRVAASARAAEIKFEKCRNPYYLKTRIELFDKLGDNIQSFDRFQQGIDMEQLDLNPVCQYLNASHALIHFKKADLKDPITKRKLESASTRAQELYTKIFNFRDFNRFYNNFDLEPLRKYTAYQLLELIQLVPEQYSYELKVLWDTPGAIRYLVFTLQILLDVFIEALTFRDASLCMLWFVPVNKMDMYLSDVRERYYYENREFENKKVTHKTVNILTLPPNNELANYLDDQLTIAQASCFSED